MASPIKTRFLILSDTHGTPLAPEEDESPSSGSSSSTDSMFDVPADISLHNPFRRPLPRADVAIHCGDLTKASALGEYQAAFDLLREIDAPLKLVIAGNHDLVLDAEFWRNWQERVSHFMKRPDESRRDKALAVVEAARRDGIYLLDEGCYNFVLGNGASLRVYASQHTPSYGSWAFQYGEGHEFDIPEGVDVAMTHGPPKGILDRTYYGAEAGCKYLLERTAKARPRLHCFGHIHEAWGARLVTWAGPDAEGKTTVDEEKSILLEDLKSLEPQKHEDEETKREKQDRHNQMAEEKCRQASFCSSDETCLNYGKQTLFVNAAIMNLRYRPPYHMPFLVDLDLLKATEEDIANATDLASIKFPKEDLSE